MRKMSTWSKCTNVGLPFVIIQLVCNRGQPVGVNAPTPTLTRLTPDLLTKGCNPQQVKAKGVHLRSDNINIKQK